MQYSAIDYGVTVIQLEIIPNHSKDRNISSLDTDEHFE